MGLRKKLSALKEKIDRKLGDRKQEAAPQPAPVVAPQPPQPVAPIPVEMPVPKVEEIKLPEPVIATPPPQVPAEPPKPECFETYKQRKTLGGPYAGTMRLTCSNVALIKSYLAADKSVEQNRGVDISIVGAGEYSMTMSLFHENDGEMLLTAETLSDVRVTLPVTDLNALHSSIASGCDQVRKTFSIRWQGYVDRIERQTTQIEIVGRIEVA